MTSGDGNDNMSVIGDAFPSFGMRRSEVNSGGDGGDGGGMSGEDMVGNENNRSDANRADLTVTPEDDDEFDEEENVTNTSNNDDGDNIVVNDDDDENVAALAAEVSMMQDGDTDRVRGGGRRAERRAGDEAIMGAAAEGEGVGDFELIDQGGEMARVKFLEFLHCYSEPLDDYFGAERTTQDDIEMDMLTPGNNDDDEDEEEQVPTRTREPQHYFPYIEQADQLARRQLRGISHIGHENDDDDQHHDRRGHHGRAFANTLFVDFSHILSFDLELAEAIESEMVRFEPCLRKAVKSFMLDLHPELNDDAAPSAGGINPTSYFVALHNLPNILPLRHLRTDRIGKLSAVSGTVTRTSDVRPELLVGCFRCNKCGLLAENIRQQYHFTRPLLCRNPRCENRSPNEFVLEMNPSSSSSSSEFVDWQKLRVQENSDEIPPGSMPRSIDVVLRNEMVERAKAGDKCVFVGSLVVIPDGSALARSGGAPRAFRAGGRGPSEEATGGGGGVRGLKALGVRELTYRTCFVACSVVSADAAARRRAGGTNGAAAMASFLFGGTRHESGGGEMMMADEREQTAEEVALEFTEEEMAEIQRIKFSPQLYQRMIDSVAPTTFGHGEVKRGILLMLLGGVQKTTAEGIRLRGDINVCIVGDPSTAKSQFLKYVHSFLPSRTVYTSGKASSAAGLTAAVQRDQDTGEYCIEAGALMLADNGICCIDEFDKMNAADQVAIHSAMEQQLLSITKAGIQATLNARASVLAAANPIEGRYNRTKSLSANIALSAPILSRFDLFFVVLDECDEVADYNVAKHILRVHRCEKQAVRPPFSPEQMRRYIRFARTINPRITHDSQRVIVDCYRKLRQGDTMGRSRTAYRITVRQLESMIRLSEALARLYCDNEIQPSYVQEAFRLLKKSIIHVETEDVTFDNDDDDENEHNLVSGQAESVTDRGRGNDGRDTHDGNANADQSRQVRHPGEYVDGDDDHAPGPLREGEHESTAEHQESDEPPKKKRKTSKKKTQITFEQYEAISNAIATYLRSKEREADEGKESESSYLTWGEAAQWYLEQCEEEIGGSMEELERLRKLTNLVIRRLIQVDHVLIYVGGDGSSEDVPEEQRRIAVHPNFVIS